MELLVGQTLKQGIKKGIPLAKQGPFSTAQLLDLGVQIAEGLDAAHSQGIVQGDSLT